MSKLSMDAPVPSPKPSPFTIKPVRIQRDLEEVITLFYAYAASLGFDLGFQSFEAEMAAMPGKYAPPHGELLLARNVAGEAIGCVALRPLAEAGVCEMKRLYVPPEGRQMGLGRALAASIIDVACKLGYQEMRLDSIPTMLAALKLYESIGFVDIAPYYNTPLAGTRFLSLNLNACPHPASK